MAASLAAAAPAPSLEVAVDGLRSQRGNLLICLTRDRRHFPDCSGDPQARKLTVAAAAHAARFDDLPAGAYALSLIHDENGNGKLDTRLGIPREGVGFSRNPRLMFGPPGFDAVRMEIGAATSTRVRVKYFF